MSRKSYTFVIASSQRGTVRKFRVPFYALHALLALAIVGGVTVVAGLGSYSRMLWKVGNYNDLRREQAQLKKQYTSLQAVVKDSNQRLTSLQSLATEVAMSYGIMRFRQTPFGLTETLPGNQDPLLEEAAFKQSVDQFNFLVRNATSVTLAANGIRLLPGRGLDDLSFTPSLWPVMGTITGSFGERLDPFNGEGAFHAGVDISTAFGEQVRVTAEGLVVAVEVRPGYGRMVVVEHGFGISTCYGHLSGFNTHVGARVSRGEVIGYVGVSGRSTGPHVHYEVRINGAPVNPWRFLHNSPTGATD